MRPSSYRCYGLLFLIFRIKGFPTPLPFSSGIDSNTFPSPSRPRGLDPPDGLSRCNNSNWPFQWNQQGSNLRTLFPENCTVSNADGTESLHCQSVKPDSCTCTAKTSYRRSVMAARWARRCIADSLSERYLSEVVHHSSHWGKLEFLHVRLLTTATWLQPCAGMVGVCGGGGGGCKCARIHARTHVRTRTHARTRTTVLFHITIRNRQDRKLCWL